VALLDTPEDAWLTDPSVCPVGGFVSAVASAAAAARFARGAAFLAEKEWEQALGLLAGAYKVSCKPAALMGVCASLRGMKRLRSAKVAYQRLLDFHGGELGVDEVSSVKANIKALEGATK
jgi:hypothetical protein